MISEMRDIIGKETHPIYVIMDLLVYNISLNDLFVGTGVGIKSRDSSDRGDSVEKTLKTIIVTEQKILQASIKGFERFGFGKNLELAATIDEALKIIQAAA